MTELLTAAQMRAFEGAAIRSGAVTGLDLMERAGRGVVAAILSRWPEIGQGSRRAVILCGPGNNGGDGLVIARRLKEAGCEVRVFLLGDPAALPPDARDNCDRWLAMGPVQPLGAAGEALAQPPDLVVDALFGTGLTRPLDGETAAAVRAVPPGPRVCAVDAPSGLCLDSGRPLQTDDGTAPCIAADLTVTFHGPKLGHHLAEGPAFCGSLAVVDIGLAATGKTDSTVLGLVERPSARRLNKSGPHKYAHGHAIILSGPATRTGAARLAARGALRTGAGLVTVASPPDALAENAAHLTAIMLRPVADAGGLTEMLRDGRLNALCLGPGLGGGEPTRTMVKAALKARAAGANGGGVVLDADALTAFETAPEDLFEWLGRACVLTPHGGEFARLFPDISHRLAEPPLTGPAYSRADAARAAAARAGCTVLFKGPDTVIADPDGSCRVHSGSYGRAAPWLATAGSGDVLTGMITGLLARGFAPPEAAATAAWLHTDCALSFGPGLIAEDLLEEIPHVLQELP